MSNILKDIDFQCRVSTVLNRDVKQFGKHGMFDGDLDSCWSSDQGSPQWIYINLSIPTLVSRFAIQFQGGFVGQDCHIELISDDSTVMEPFYPEDNNLVQSFQLSRAYNTTKLKLVFNKSTDFFGRIIIYDLSLYT